MMIFSALLLALAVGLAVYALLSRRRHRTAQVQAAIAQLTRGAELDAQRLLALDLRSGLPRLLLATLVFIAGWAWLPFPLPLTILLALGVFLADPVLSAARAQTRKRRITDLLPLSVSQLASEIGSATPLPTALQRTATLLAAEKHGAPLAEIWQQVAVAAQTRGAQAALAELGATTEIPTLAYVAASLALHAEQGGDFQPALQKLAKNLQTLNAQLSAARAEVSGARGTVWVLIAFSVVASFINLSDPTTAAYAFYHTGAGTLVLAGLVLWMVLGYFVLQHMLSEIL
ncbi:MAG: type II secretion system F family protein [Chloroflexota bacterium]|nr:type II secretion system F family protein [Chloroflexota bacterium]